MCVFFHSFKKIYPSRMMRSSFFRFVLNMCVEIVAAAAAAIIKEYQQEQRGRKEIGRVEQ